MPNVFVIGAMKCGTTSLHHYLGLHPEISMSKEKEPNFFVSPDAALDQRVGESSRYLGLFASGMRYRGESSTTYTRFPFYKGIPEAIAAEIPEAKLIYLVRDPVERVEAQVGETLSARLGDAKHIPADIEISKLLGDLGEAPNEYIDPGRYMTQIRQYLDHFPDDSLLVVDSDDLRGNRRATLATIFRFLGVEDGFWDERMEVERNTAADKKRRTELYVRLSEVAILKWAVDHLPPVPKRDLIRLARTGLSRHWEYPRLDEDLRRRLEELYRSEVEELRQFTGLDFAGWSI